MSKVGYGALYVATAFCVVSPAALAWSETPECAVHAMQRAQPRRYSLDGQAFVDRHCRRVSPLPWTEPLSVAEARAAVKQALALASDEGLAEAVLLLRVVESALPGIADHVALIQGEALLGLGQPEQACRYYEIALRSPNRDVAALGRIGRVLCFLRAGDREGENALRLLVKRYPSLPQAPDLRYELARAREGWGNRWGALVLYRSIDLKHPGSPAAEKARQRMKALAEQGAQPRALTWEERTERAARLLRTGPLGLARQAVAELLEARGLPAEFRARAHLIAAEMARKEARWNKAREEVIRARNQGVAIDAGNLMPPAAPDKDISDNEQVRKQGLNRIKVITRGRPMKRLRTQQLVAVLELSVRYGLGEPANEALAALRYRKGLRAEQRFNLAMKLTGVASDERVAEWLEGLLRVPRYRVAARYHLARALERMGRFGEAEAEYLEVIDRDKSATRYYAMWADQRLWAVQNQRTLSCVPREVDRVSGKGGGQEEAPEPSGNGAGRQSSETENGADALELVDELWVGGAYGPPADAGDRAPGETEKVLELDPLSRSALAASLLQPIVARHAEAYPWIARAQELARLGLFRRAADELHETYLAWRDARGSPRLRSGLEALFLGSAPPRRPANWALRRARQALNRSARLRLARVADLLGDPGVAFALGGWKKRLRPQAYAEEVEAAARGQGLDPNLLFAVMRVESIFHRRIVSRAGAVGLMQIMPRTGALIAERLNRKGFSIVDLLEPAVSLEFSAWYLRSLLERFQGRLPLAIAAYNGGPHNVYLWLRSSNRDMPLDSFLERIPLKETHRYVRRVLTHYRAYRAQEGLPMVALEVELPQTRPDEVAF